MTADVLLLNNPSFPISAFLVHNARNPSKPSITLHHFPKTILSPVWVFKFQLSILCIWKKKWLRALEKHYSRLILWNGNKINWQTSHREKLSTMSAQDRDYKGVLSFIMLTFLIQDGIGAKNKTFNFPKSLNPYFIRLSYVPWILKNQVIYPSKAARASCIRICALFPGRASLGHHIEERLPFSGWGLKGPHGL